MKEHTFDYFSEDMSEDTPLTSNHMLVGIILPKTKIQRTPYSPQVELRNLSRVTHDPVRSILIVIGEAPNKMKICQYFRSREVKTIPLNFSAS